MNLLGCLQTTPPSGDASVLGQGVFGAAVAFLLVTLIVVALATPLIRRAFRRHVVRLMGLDSVAQRPEAWWKLRGKENLALESSAVPAPADATGLLARAIRNERRIGLASIAALFAFSLAALPLPGWVDPAALSGSGVDTALFIYLLCLPPTILNLPPTWRRKATVAGIVIGLAMVLVVEAFSLGAPEVPDGPDELPDWVGWVAIAVLVPAYAAVFHRRFRGLAVPSALLAGVVVVSVVLPVAALEEWVGDCLRDTSVETKGAEAAAVGLKAWHSGLEMIAIGLFMVALWLGFQALKLMTTAVERGWANELSLSSLAGFGIISTVAVFMMVPEEHAASEWVALLPFAWTAVPVVVYRALLWGTNRAQGRPLLMLRVFSRDRRRQRFLDEVQSRWRCLGPVKQAGGPDLVDVNVDPYECALFLSNRLHDVFLPQAVSPEVLRQRFHWTSDAEGRFRVNEMFNFNTAWRCNVEALILMSPTILLDLRGLTAEREGTSYEVGLLAGHGLLDRVVAIGDDGTDWDHVAGMLAAHEKGLDDLDRRDVEGLGDVESLVQDLLAVQDRAAPVA